MDTTSTLSIGAALLTGVAIGVHWKRISSFFFTTTTTTTTTTNKQTTLSKRLKYFSEAQSISYKNTEPLMALQTSMQYVIDSTGTSFLDSRNNVGHVGWCHPHVVQAIQEQVALCSANSRYLHPKRALLAERLLAHFPKELCVVFLVNSGSEANDLALRLARTHTQHHDAIVVDHAYHGHTNATLSLSPYKYNHKGGERYKQEWVHKVSCPDMYRGKHANMANKKQATMEYSNEVPQACQQSTTHGKKVAAFFIESGMSVGGVILPPEGYLEQCYTHVRNSGGVCIADEVQTGFGRFGSSFWGFQQQGVVPDIVTLGKPFGNGFPLAAVVTTKEIAASFSNGLEYFNTFGGSPVACAAGLAVLDVLESEQLQQHALNVGNHIMQRLRRFVAQEAQEAQGSSLATIGDVRGCGLFIGIELVRDTTTKEPATAETSILCSRLKKENRILTSIDGPHDNVIVIKPPMCFTLENADALIDAMLKTLPKITQEEVLQFIHTPT
jgi:ethanolamine-phosphate phospho-lyase